jgi:hypothetical protein
MPLTRILPGDDLGITAKLYLMGVGGAAAAFLAMLERMPKTSPRCVSSRLVRQTRRRP